MMVAAFGTGREEGAFGLFGGADSPRSKLLLCYPDGQVIDVPANANIDQVPPETIMKKWNTGGGGYGPPKKRAIDKIEHDLREGYVSRGEAHRAYGYSEDRV